MYLYFDSGGILKEIINDKPLRQNSSGWNTIFCYFEDNTIGLTKDNGTIRYVLSDGNDYIVNGTNWLTADAYALTQIPIDQYRDLTHFEYNKNYWMFKFVVPDNVLAISGVLGICIRILDADNHIISMQRVACMVEPTTNAGSVYSGADCIGIDTTISVAEYNDLYRQIENVTTDTSIYFATYNSTTLAQIGNAISSGKVPVCYYNSEFYVYSVTNVVVSPPSTEIVFTRVEGDTIYELKVDDSNAWTSSSKTLLESLTFDNTPTDGSDNPVTSDGIYEALALKQDTLSDGVNIKTINGNSVVGSGNIASKNLLPSIVGHAGKVLKVNADGDNVVWANESGGMNNPMNNQGDIIYGEAIGTPTRLAKGSAGQVLTMNSLGTIPEWKTPTTGMSNPMNNVGDIIIGGTDGTPTKLAIGSSGQVLTSNGTTLTWQNPSGGGGGGGGSGTQLYQHDFTITDVAMGSTTTETYRAITTSSTAFTISTILTDLINTLMFLHNKSTWGWTTCIYNYGLYAIYEFTSTSASNCQSLLSISNVTDVVTAL